MRKLSTWVLILMLVVAMAFGAAAAETQNNDQALAQIVETGVYYSDLSDAMQAATDGQTVRLLKDAEEVILTVKEHTTLDLNGCTLTVTYASVFGYMEDNSAANTGVLKVAEKKLLINSKNSQLPVKTENGYQFVEVLGFHTVWANENTFVFQPLFEKAGNELLKSGVANTGVSIQVEVTWKPAVGSEDLDSRTFKYGGTLINEYFNSYNAETGKYGKMFTLTLVNPDNFVDLVCYSKVVSAARVAFTPDQNNSDGHVWTDATCTAPKTCSVCGATEGEALGHSEETVAGKAATCTEDGLTEGKKCTVCGVTTVEQTVIDAKGHTEETVAGKAATCTATGLTDGKVCTVCGVTTEEQTEIPATGHTEETVAGKAATCTEDGLTEGKKCTVCGVTTVEQTVIDAKGHTEETVAGKAATCTENGLTEGKKCTVCGVTTVEQTVIDAKGHTEETVAGKAATCTEDGLIDGKKCTVCGVTTVAQTVINAKGHTEETVTGKAATCTETGLTEGKKCTVCGVTTVEQTVIESKGHTFVDGTCENCGEPDPDAGNEGVVSTLAIFELGKNGAAEHKESSTAVTTYKETVYNYTLSITGGNKMYTSCNDAKGNGCIKLGTSSAVGGFSFTVPADVTEVVIYVAKYKANATKITVNGVSYTISGSSNDGAYDAITVDTTSTKTVTLTTVSGGVRAMVNAIEYKGINNCKHANIEDVTAKAATCTQSGNTAGTKCADCGAIMTGCEEIEATGHQNTTTTTVDATCTMSGSTTVKCDDCGETVNTTEIPATGHSVTTGTCPDCGETLDPTTSEPVVVLEITKADFNTTSYAANNGTKTKNGYSYTTNQIMNQQSTMQWQKSKGYITIASNVFTKLELKVAAGTFTVTVGGKTVKGTTVNGVTTYDLTGLTGQVKISVGGATGKVDYLKFYK